MKRNNTRDIYANLVSFFAIFWNLLYLLLYKLLLNNYDIDNISFLFYIILIFYKLFNFDSLIYLYYSPILFEKKQK